MFTKSTFDNKWKEKPDAELLIPLIVVFVTLEIHMRFIEFTLICYSFKATILLIRQLNETSLFSFFESTRIILKTSN